MQNSNLNENNFYSFHSYRNIEEVWVWEFRVTDYNFFFRLHGFADVIKPTYSVSERGKLVLVHDGFKYTQNGDARATHDGITTRWRCRQSISGLFPCKAKAYTKLYNDGVEHVTFNGSHCHPAKSESKWVLFNAVVSIIIVCKRIQCHDAKC